MAPLELTYLNGPDVDRLALTDDEILDAVEAALSGAPPPRRPHPPAPPHPPRR